MSGNLLVEGERLDDLQCKGYYIIQNPNEFCFGMDAVLLADFAKARSTDRVMDLCTGTGIVPILMEARGFGGSFTGLEIQEHSADMATRSMLYNGLADKIKITRGDVRRVRESFAASSYEVVTANPPYIKDNHGLENELSALNIARHEILLSLEDVISAAAYLLVPGGHFYMVHKPFRLAEIFEVMKKYKLEPKRMRMVQPYADKEPNMVLIDAALGGKSMIKVEPALVVYNADGSYTEQLLKVYG